MTVPFAIAEFDEIFVTSLVCTVGIVGYPAVTKVETLLYDKPIAFSA